MVFLFMNIEIDVYFNHIEGSKKPKGYFRHTIKALENLYNSGIKLNKGDEIFIHYEDIDSLDYDLVKENNLEDMFILKNTCYFPKGNAFLLQFETI